MAFDMPVYNKDRPDWATLACEIAWESRTGMSCTSIARLNIRPCSRQGSGWRFIRRNRWRMAKTSSVPADNDHDRALLISARTPGQGNSSVSHR
jgi:hypothetical protein